MPDAIAALSAALLGRYRMERELGGGGMATVYLAEDMRHHRRVAIKLLHAEISVALGQERFLREIELTANLQHPHILPLFDSGAADGLLYYVMPYVEGETLRGRLTREHQLPIADAVRIAREVADALEYAHRRNVIHRDIKPENILLHDGCTLVVDFGIALAVQQAAGARLTQTGLSLGTPQYMAPEQAMGEAGVDQRADIFALGAVTYEMLSGEPPFTGSSAQAIIAKVMTEEPKGLIGQRHTIPPHLERAVLTALEKLPADRFSSARAFSDGLDGVAALRGPAPAAHSTPSQRAAAPAEGAVRHPRRHRPARHARHYRVARAVWPWAIAAAGLTAAAVTLLRDRSRPGGEALYTSLVPPGGCVFAQLSDRNLPQLSADGRELVVVAECDNRNSMWLYSLATGTLRELGGTNNALYPFWSPDGRSLGFFADARLKRIDLSTGAVRDLAPARNGRGGSWSVRNEILFAPDVFGQLFRISADGGTPDRVTTPPTGGMRSTDRLPMFLPDGRQFLFSRGDGTLTQGIPRGAVLVGRLGSPRTRTLLNEPTNVALSAGSLLYMQRGVLMARPFDAGAATFTGAPAAIVPDIDSYALRHLGQYTAGSRARLAYRASLNSKNQLSRFDPATGSLTPMVAAGAIQSTRLSPNGQWVLVSRTDQTGPRVSAWVLDRAAQRWTRVPVDPSIYYAFAWAPDGRRFAIQAADDTSATIIGLNLTVLRKVRGTGPATAVIESWSPDGTYALGRRQVAAQGFDLTRVQLDQADPSPETVGATAADEQSPRISPDGTLVAFTSNETGRAELFVATLPGLSNRIQLSEDGVKASSTFSTDVAAWSRDGRTLYFVQLDGRLMSVAVGASGPRRFGSPQPVRGAPRYVISMDGEPDGSLVILYAYRTDLVPLTLVERWTSLMEER